MSAASPIVNLPNLYVNNLNVAFGSTTTLTVAAGQCRDSTNTYDMVLSSPVTISSARRGLNGLDAGTIAASTDYWIHLISDPVSGLPTGAMLSLSATTPSMPLGYGVSRMIGWWSTNGSANFLLAYILGNGNSRKHLWDAEPGVLSSGHATTFANVSLIHTVPVMDNVLVTLDVRFNPNTAGNSCTLKPGGSSTGASPTVSGNVAAKVEIEQVQLLSKLVSSIPTIAYTGVEASDATSIFINMFEYYI